MAEAVRFELTEDSHPRQFSRLLHSTALPRFQAAEFNLLITWFLSAMRKNTRWHDLAGRRVMLVGGIANLRLCKQASYNHGFGNASAFFNEAL